MKFFFLHLCFFLTVSGWAQSKISSNDTQWLHQKKYPSGRWSAYSYLLKSTGNGKAACFTPQGKIMLESSVSRNHGHHSVTFWHHPNGVVSKAEISQAPDAGIQWYRTTITFNDKGEKTGEETRSHEDLERLTLIDPQFERPTTHVKPAPVTAQPCAILYSNVLVVENLTQFPIQVQFAARKKIKTYRIPSGNHIAIDTLIQAQFFQNPQKEGILQIQFSKSNKKWECTTSAFQEKQTNPTTTCYTVQVLQKKKKINPKSRSDRKAAPSLSN
jgi:hypothetical protein